MRSNFKWSKRVVAAAVAVACVLSLGTASAQAEPLRIGVLSPLTGTLAGPGQDAVEGIKLAFEELDYVIAGRPVQLFYEDTAASPTLTVQKTQRLVERERVQLILGPLSGSEAIAMKAFAPRIPEVTVVVAGAASEDVTMRGIEPNVFRTSYSGAQVMFDFGSFAYEELGFRNVAILGQDYAFPHTQIGGFVASFCLAGGNVPRRFWVPMGTADFSSVLLEIPADVDALFVTLGGADAVNFFRQADEFGVLDRLTILAGSVTVDATILEHVGHLLEGMLSGSHFAQVLPYPEFVEFNERFEERVGRPPSLFAADYYVAAKVAIAALLEVDGNIEDQSAYRAALQRVEMATPRGPFSFDDFQNVVLTARINQVQDFDGVFRNVPLANFPNATQFGPFDPDWYQNQPPFDRTNPVCEEMKDAVLAD